MDIALVQEYLSVLIFPALLSTTRVLFLTAIYSIFFGFIISIILIMTHPYGLNPHKKVYSIISFVMNTIRSFPGIVLIVAIAPLTRAVVGTMIGEKAAILPLTIGSIPFVSNTLENAFLAVDSQLILAAKSFGATNLQIIFKVIIIDALPNIIRGLTLCMISFLKITVLAGVVGAGGIGSVALNYGFYSFNNIVLYFCVFILFIYVHLIQFAGEMAYKKIIK